MKIYLLISLVFVANLIRNLYLLRSYKTSVTQSETLYAVMLFLSGLGASEESWAWLDTKRLKCPS